MFIGTVSRWFVATAAHCVQRARPKEIAVWLGALDTRAQAPPAEKHRCVIDVFIVKYIQSVRLCKRLKFQDRFQTVHLCISFSKIWLQYNQLY